MPDDPEHPTIFRLVADDSGSANVLLTIDHLELWNTSYFQMAFRKAPGKSNAPVGRMKIRLQMADGGRVAIEEEQSPNAPSSVSDGASRWQLPLSTPGAGWTYATLGTTQLRWGDGRVGDQWKRPALPIGRVKTVQLTLVDASPETTLDIAYIRALRESGNGERVDAGKLLGGQVTRLGVPAGGINVELSAESGAQSTTTTDSNGNYFFYDVGRGQRVAIAALDRGRRCMPKMGAELIVLRNNPEIDIDVDSCGRGSSP